MLVHSGDRDRRGVSSRGITLSKIRSFIVIVIITLYMLLGI